jgi:hypothetical protein
VKVVAYAEDTLIGVGTKAVSYVPAPLKTRIETVYATAGQAVQDLATSIAASVSNVSAKLVTIKDVASNTLTRTWNRLPDSITTRASVVANFTTAKVSAIKEQLSVVADFSATKMIAAREQANGAWKYASEDPKARTTAKAIAGGVTAGGTTGFITGGAVGAVVGIIPALFTFGLSIPLGAAIGSGVGLGCGAAAGGAVGLASGAVYTNKAEMARSASMYTAYVKDQASHIQGRASAAMPTLRLRSSGA